MNPDNALSYHYRAISYQVLGEFEKADQDLRMVQLLQQQWLDWVTNHFQRINPDWRLKICVKKAVNKGYFHLIFKHQPTQPNTIKMAREFIPISDKAWVMLIQKDR